METEYCNQWRETFTPLSSIIDKRLHEVARLGREEARGRAVEARTRDRREAMGDID
jgi:hypothetical protein